MHPVGDLLAGRGDPRPASVTVMIRARRSAGEGRRTAYPADSSSSSVTTMVVLSRSASFATSIWVSPPGIAFTSTQCPRGVIPISANAAVIRVASTWLM